MQISKRKPTFWVSFPGVTSKRVKIILSKNADAKKMAGAIRDLRKTGNVSFFQLEHDTQKKINEALENAS